MDQEEDDRFAVEEGWLSGDDHGRVLEGHHPDALSESESVSDLQGIFGFSLRPRERKKEEKKKDGQHHCATNCS